MYKARVLYLSEYPDTWMRDLEIKGGLEVEVTSLARSDIRSSGGYIVSQLGRDLAARATPDRYDLVVIGNNLGTGFEYARLIPEAMRSRTLIVWNWYKVGNEETYTSYGFEHFCSRDEQVEYLLKMLDGDINFVDPADDTPENRNIVRIVRQRSRSDCGSDRSLEEVAAELGVQLPALR